MPVGSSHMQYLTVIDVDDKGQVMEKTKQMPVMYVPLTDAEKQRGNEGKYF